MASAPPCQTALSNGWRSHLASRGGASHPLSPRRHRRTINRHRPPDPEHHTATESRSSPVRDFYPDRVRVSLCWSGVAGTGLPELRMTIVCWRDERHSPAVESVMRYDGGWSRSSSARPSKTRFHALSLRGPELTVCGCGFGRPRPGHVAWNVACPVLEDSFAITRSQHPRSETGVRTLSVGERNSVFHGAPITRRDGRKTAASRWCISAWPRLSAFRSDLRLQPKETASRGAQTDRGGKRESSTVEPLDERDQTAIVAPDASTAGE